MKTGKEAQGTDVALHLVRKQRFSTAHKRTHDLSAPLLSYDTSSSRRRRKRRRRSGSGGRRHCRPQFRALSRLARAGAVLSLFTCCRACPTTTTLLTTTTTTSLGSKRGGKRGTKQKSKGRRRSSSSSSSEEDDGGRRLPTMAQCYEKEATGIVRGRLPTQDAV